MRGLLGNAQGEMRELMRKKTSRTPWNALSILTCIFWPMLLFMYEYNIVYGSLRFYSPWGAFAAGPVAGSILCLIVTAVVRKRLRAVEPARTFLTLAVCLWIALFSALYCADRNFWWYQSSYFGFQDLAAYTNVDPSADKGQSFMDSGQIYFKEGSKVDVSQVVNFKSDSTYCVAPIVSHPLVNTGDGEDVMKMPESGTVDFWAVGMDCCSPSNFTCGMAGNHRARAGLRLLRDDSRPFYLMAVQEWIARVCPVDTNTAAGVAEAAPLVCIPAKHPLFFHWVVDPLLEVDNFHERAVSLCGVHTALFLVCDAAVALTLLWVFFDIGLQ